METDDRDRDTKTLQSVLSQRVNGPSRSYLHIFEGSSSYLFGLPSSGEVVIGRAQETDVRLSDPTASRKHASITITDHDIRIRDLESHNGTLVNGESVTLPRSLISGDVVSICNVTLVFHRQPMTRRPRMAVEFVQFRQRLDEEIERAERYQRPLALVVFELGDPALDRAQVMATLADELRLIDLPAWGATSRLFMIMPEVLPASLQETIEHLLDRLRPLAPKGRAGYAIFLTDGTDGDTLIAGARAAAVAVPPGRVGCVGDLKSVRKIGDDELILADPAMFSVVDLIERLAQSDISVLVCGETGTGKDLVARALHHWSSRHRRQLVAINCAALQDALAESQLFGHVKGAFTGTVGDHIGFLESAAGGTVFLDEIGEISLPVQAKLLRALEAKRVRPLGSSVERPFDARLVVATNRDLEREVAAGRFREDLYYRLNVGVIPLPPLRSRKRELPILARAFLQMACQRRGRPTLTLTDPVLERLHEYTWPGNIRQLKNAMEFVGSTVDEQSVELWHLPAFLRDPLAANSEASPAAPASSAEVRSPQRSRSFSNEMRTLEIQRIQQELKDASGSVAQAAVRLNMPIRTLYYKIKQYGLKPPSSPRV